MNEPKPMTYMPYDVLPEARDWRVGKTYRAKVVMKQVGMGQEGANFELMDATSLEPTGRTRYFLSEGGSYKGS